MSSLKFYIVECNILSEILTLDISMKELIGRDSLVFRYDWNFLAGKKINYDTQQNPFVYSN